MVTGNPRRGQDQCVVGGLADGSYPAATQAEMFVKQIRTLYDREAVLGFYEAVNRSGSDRLRSLLGYTKIGPAGWALSPLTGIRFLDPKPATALASH